LLLALRVGQPAGRQFSPLSGRELAYLSNKNMGSRWLVVGQYALRAKVLGFTFHLSDGRDERWWT